MITKEQLSEDQRASFIQMTMEGGLGEEEALELIQEFTIDKGMTGLRVQKYSLTPEGKRVAWELWMDGIMGTELSDAFRRATKGKGVLQYILACVCIVVCFPLGLLRGLAKILCKKR